MLAVVIKQLCKISFHDTDKKDQSKIKFFSVLYLLV